MEPFPPSIPNDNSLSNTFIYSAESGDKEKVFVSPNTSYHTDKSDLSNSYFVRDYNWEYFSNELEYE